ncbi:hypothetical protein [Spiroplasma endosymbiont of Danaus chrysippus]|uniref:hypothetical protein n=1 Tax=Spiroplasma endosymbiont of Danaus chrysippus TaxID=2691041 RepID=UPI00157AB7B8|nr:hypothetical protein [Spiroplasma endosymbiont of Danaus chrysippus]
MKIIDNETKWIQGFKDIEIRNNSKELLNQFIEHYSNYLYEISFLISRYEITDFFYCHYCKNKYKQEEWFIFLKNLKSGEQWVWNLSKLLAT